MQLDAMPLLRLQLGGQQIQVFQLLFSDYSNSNTVAFIYQTCELACHLMWRDVTS